MTGTWGSDTIANVYQRSIARRGERLLVWAYDGPGERPARMDRSARSITAADPAFGGMLCASAIAADVTSIRLMSAVVLRGPSNSAPEAIVGPFSSMEVAAEWAEEHPRPGGYSIAQELTVPGDID